MESFFFFAVLVNAALWAGVRYLAIRKTEEKAFRKISKQVRKYFLLLLVFGIVLCFFFLENVFPFAREILWWIYGLALFSLVGVSLFFGIREKQRIERAVNRRITREKRK